MNSNEIQTLENEFRFLKPGTKVNLTNCATEAIHLVGSIQAHGFLVALEQSSLAWAGLSDNIQNFGSTQTATEWLKDSPISFLGNALLQWIKDSPFNSTIPLFKTRVELPWNHGDFFDVQFRVHAGFLFLEFEHSEESRCETLLGELLKLHDGASSAAMLASSSVALLRAITGFDQCILYRFDDCFH